MVWRCTGSTLDLQLYYSIVTLNFFCATRYTSITKIALGSIVFYMSINNVYVNRFRQIKNYNFTKDIWVFNFFFIWIADPKIKQWKNDSRYVNWLPCLRYTSSMYTLSIHMYFTFTFSIYIHQLHIYSGVLPSLYMLNVYNEHNVYMYMLNINVMLSTHCPQKIVALFLATLYSVHI